MILQLQKNTISTSSTALKGNTGGWQPVTKINRIPWRPADGKYGSPSTHPLQQPSGEWQQTAGNQRGNGTRPSLLHWKVSQRPDHLMKEKKIPPNIQEYWNHRDKTLDGIMFKGEKRGVRDEQVWSTRSCSFWHGKTDRDSRGEILKRPWHIVVTDLFTWNNTELHCHNTVVVDSRQQVHWDGETTELYFIISQHQTQSIQHLPVTALQNLS